MYNYKHFKPEYYDFSKFEGPKPGEEAIDFEATLLNGEKKKLSDYFGKWVVLETGSITCPIYESKIEEMNRLAKEFPDVEFLVLYVREAHPGENIPKHDSFEHKLSCATRAREEDGEERTILVDDAEGTAHKMYGSMPNSVYVINPGGRVVFRGDWNSIKALRGVLKERAPEKIHKKERCSARPSFFPGLSKTKTVLDRAGKTSRTDFVKSMPKMIFKHTSKIFSE